MKREIRTAIVVPATLRDAFVVLLTSAPNIELIASVTHVETLLAEIGEDSPEVILIYLPENADNLEKCSRALEQIEWLKKAWAKTGYIVIVKDTYMLQEVKGLGVDTIF